MANVMDQTVRLLRVRSELLRVRSNVPFLVRFFGKSLVISVNSD